jgi:5-methyltetrahydrofolate--homocysteine methyltransferase
MAETVALLRKEAPMVKIMVGGAVLTQEYADQLGADAYAKDGMGAVRKAEIFYSEIQ